MTLLDTPADLELLIRARYGLIVLETLESEPAEEILRKIASNLSLHYHFWTRSKGMRRGGNFDPLIERTQEPIDALQFVAREGTGIFLMRDLAPYLDDPHVASHVQDIAGLFGAKRGALVITGHHVRLPDSLRPHATTLRLPAPGFEAYRQMLERVVREHAARMPLRLELTNEDRTRLINNLMGLTMVEAEKIVTRQIIEDGALRPSDVEGVMAAKRQVVRQDGLLEYYPAETELNDVAGLAGLKGWLSRRRAVVTDPQRASQFGLSFPKGVLLLGVPGCGKSLCAKAVAGEWGLPLLKLDPANLYDKYVGDSEKNFKRALHTAERMAPVVLWIDELEKAFAAGGSEDGGVSRRVFGGFLSWLQERRGDVFVVATANDISALPPEFIRKGRFDEVFFVDLPGAQARQGILELHLLRRKQEPPRFDLPRLVAATEGFSGAEIEESIVSGLFSAFASDIPLSTGILLAEIAATRPLSRTMAERLDALREWARGRTVWAD